jgi:hypothetical protein
MLSCVLSDKKTFREKRDTIGTRLSEPFFCQSAPSYILPSNLADKDIPPLRGVESIYPDNPIHELEFKPPIVSIYFERT